MPVSLLNTDTSFPSFQEETPLRERVDEMTNYLYMLLEELRYVFGNLGEENFNENGLNDIAKKITSPISVEIEAMGKSVAEIKVDADANGASIKELLSWQETAEETLTGLTESVVSVNKKADDNEASIMSIAQWQKTVEEGTIESISSIKQQADENEADIQLMTSWKSTVDDELDRLDSSMAVLDMIATENEASISQIVSAVGSGGRVTAASIVAAVNEAGSSVKISADHVDITGFVTFEDLSGDGTATVNGNNISLISYPEGDSISELGFWKYRYTDFDPESETADELMFRIRTIDNERNDQNKARFAAVLQTFDRIYENNTRYPVALKLISGGDMSLESEGIIYMYAGDVAQFAAYGNVRIEAVRTYASAENFIPTNETDYVFCTDGIYYGGKKIVSV